MRTIILSVMVSLMIIGCATERAASPQLVSVNPRVDLLSGEEVFLTIFDSRIDPTNTAILEDTIYQQFRATYPSISFHRTEDSMYGSDPTQEHITIRIGIAAYRAEFGSKVTVGIGTFGGTFVSGIIPEGVWNGLTGFVVSIYDNRNGQNHKFQRTMRQLVSKPNMWGYTTADAALRESYQNAIQELLFFVDDSLSH